MLVAIRLGAIPPDAPHETKLNIEMFHWSPGSCATLDGGDWIGFSTENFSSHPSNSESEFVTRCITSPGNYHIVANNENLTITTNKEVIYHVEF